MPTSSSRQDQAAATRRLRGMADGMSPRGALPRGVPLRRRWMASVGRVVGRGTVISPPSGDGRGRIRVKVVQYAAVPVDHSFPQGRIGPRHRLDEDLVEVAELATQLVVDA